MKTTDYINAVKRALKINSLELSKRLEITSGAMSHYESGNRVIDNYAAIKLAQMLKINPLRIIVQAEIERGSKKEKVVKQHFWFTLREQLTEEAKKNKEPFA